MKGTAGNPTAKGETDLFFLNVVDGHLDQRFELADIIQNQQGSKCRFLHFKGRKVYIVDLGT